MFCDKQISMQFDKQENKILWNKQEKFNILWFAG